MAGGDASLEGIKMRSFVCGQCRVEYCFKGPDKRLTYPWAKGIKIEQNHGAARCGLHSPSR